MIQNDTVNLKALRAIVDNFAVEGELSDAVQIKKGYINRTYFIETQAGDRVHRYTLQRINSDVFPDVDLVMHNYNLAGEYLRHSFRLPGGRDVGSLQSVIRTRSGGLYHRAASGCWRMLSHFSNVYSMDIPDCPQTFYYTGLAFGEFVRQINRFPAGDFKAVIPNFHNTQSRYLDLEKAIDADPVGRLEEALPEVAFIRAHRELFPLISSRLESGVIPYRTCHNDCNLNNILFDTDSRLPVAIIDLDTVMPGSPLYDFGDSIRIGTNTATDDEKDLSLVHFDLALYEQYARGYLTAAGSLLSEEELALLPYAPLVITSEDGIRFLMDFINGDTYYTTSYEEQNLDRSRTQLTLLADMERSLPDIRRVLGEIYRELGLPGDPFRYQFSFTKE